MGSLSPAAVDQDAVVLAAVVGVLAEAHRGAGAHRQLRRSTEIICVVVDAQGSGAVAAIVSDWPEATVRPLGRM